MKAEKIDNYCATVVRVSKLLPLERLDNLVYASVMTNNILVSKDVKLGDIMLHFPIEASLSHTFLSYNNLYKDPTLNNDPNKKGYFEQSGRVKATKFKGYISEGFLMPISSLSYIPDLDIGALNIGDQFNILNGHNVCKKYSLGHSSKFEILQQKKGKASLVTDQFRFHYDTVPLWKVSELVLSDNKNLLTITKKLHGKSGISTKLLCFKTPSLIEKIAKMFGVQVVDREYKNIWSSRTVIRSHLIQDEWYYANQVVLPFLKNGMSVYYEIVGYDPNGKPLQEGYDYGCVPPKGSYTYLEHFDIYVYRVTMTTQDGYVIEYTPEQVESFCDSTALKYVPKLWFGFVKEIPGETVENKMEYLKQTYLEKECSICLSKVPDEGVVIKVGLGTTAYKLKSFLFLQKESKDLDKGIESAS